MSTHYFLGSRWLASSVHPARWADERSPWDSVSLAYFCPTCGEVWGRMATEGREWLPVRAPCAAHSNQWQPGGVFVRPWQRLLDDYPTEVLISDFLSLFTHWQRSHT